MMDPMQNLLKQIGKHELCFDSDEQDLLHELVLFLKPLEALTNVVSSSNTVSVLPLIKHKVEKLLLISANDSAAIKHLKKSCDTKLDICSLMSDTAALASMLDLCVKLVFSNDGLLDKLLSAAIVTDEDNGSTSQPLQNGMRSDVFVILNCMK